MAKNLSAEEIFAVADMYDNVDETAASADSEGEKVQSAHFESMPSGGASPPEEPKDTSKGRVEKTMIPAVIEAGKQRLRKCVHCLNSCLLDDGIECLGAVGEAPHSICTECFKGAYSAHQLAPEYRQLFKEHGCKFVCLWCKQPGKSGAVFFQGSDLEVLSLLGDEGFRRYQTVRDEILAQKVREETEAALFERIAREKAGADSVEFRVPQHRNHINDEILTIRCPNPECHQAIAPSDDQDPGFDACFAVTHSKDLGGCGYHFCAWCRKLAYDTTEEVHFHVKICKLNPVKGQLFGTAAGLKEVQRRQRGGAVASYLQHKVAPEHLDAVLQAIHNDLRDLDIIRPMINYLDDQPLDFGSFAGCRVLVSLVAAFGRVDAVVAATGLNAIGNVITGGDKQYCSEVLRDLGACQVVMSLLEMHGQADAAVASGGMWALMALATLASVNRHLLAELGACRVVIGMLETHGEYFDCSNHEHAFDIIASLSLEDAAHPCLCRDLGACQVMVSLFQKWGGNDSSNASCMFRIVRNLAVDTTNRRLLGEADACQVVLSTFCAFVNPDEWSSWVMSNGAKAITACAIDPDNQARFLALGAGEVLQSVIDHAAFNAETKECCREALRVLGLLVGDDSANASGHDCVGLLLGVDGNGASGSDAPSIALLGGERSDGGARGNGIQNGHDYDGVETTSSDGGERGGGGDGSNGDGDVGEEIGGNGGAGGDIGEGGQAPY